MKDFEFMYNVYFRYLRNWFRIVISYEPIFFRKLDFADQQTDIILYEIHETDPGFQFYQNR